MSELLKKIMDEQRTKLKLDSIPKDKVSQDSKCPFTGGLKLRGRVFTGVVVSKDTHRTVKVSWTTRYFVRKYERFMVKRTKIAAHNPDIINAQIGDMVIIAECRPLSKTKNFVVIKNLGHSKEYMLKRQAIEDDQKVAEEANKKKAREENAEEESNNKEQ